MQDRSPFGQSVVALTHYFVGDATMAETLEQVADATLVALPRRDSSASR